MRVGGGRMPIKLVVNYMNLCLASSEKAAEVLKNSPPRMILYTLNDGARGDPMSSSLQI